MELKNGPISLFRLILGGFQTANRAFGSALFLFILVALLSFLLQGLAVGAGFLFGPKVGLIFQLPASLLVSFFGVVFTSALIQILAAKIEKSGMRAPESFSSSIVPSFYFILSSLILGIPAAAVLFAAMLTHSALAVSAVYVALVFVMLPFMFTQHAAVLRNEGPVGALRYSWELGTAYYLHILLTLLALAGLGVCFVLGIFCALKALVPHFMQMAATGNPMLLFLQYSKIQIVTGLVIFIFLYAYALLTVQAIITGLFLNLDYCNRAAHSRELDSLAEAAAAKPRPDVVSAVMPDIAVKQASIRTQSDEDTTKQLDQVYSAQEHLAQALEQEEDRMPTILFDEAMAKQLAQTEEEMKKRKEQSGQKKEDDGPESIKMSDKTL